MRISDWSSDVCSSDLEAISWTPDGAAQELRTHAAPDEGQLIAVLDALRLCEESREEVECRGHAEGRPGNKLLATSAESISAHRKHSGGLLPPSSPGQLQHENERLQAQPHLFLDKQERHSLAPQQ